MKRSSLGEAGSISNTVAVLNSKFKAKNLRRRKNGVVEAFPCEYSFHEENTVPSGSWVYVFGSSQNGRHNKGCAKIAHANFKAEYGKSKGYIGNSFAVEVEDKAGKTVDMSVLIDGLKSFCEFVKNHPEMDFFVTSIGADNGLDPDILASALSDLPFNCSLPSQWKSSFLKSALIQ
jgi:hypothetical protein